MIVLDILGWHLVLILFEPFGQRLPDHSNGIPILTNFLAFGVIFLLMK